MQAEIDRIIEDALKALVNGEAYYDDAPFFPRCSAAVRDALARAGYTITPTTEALLVKGQAEVGRLSDGPFNQRRVLLGRSEAERTVQQIHGPINGIERMSGDELQKRLPPQYKLRA